MRSCKQLRQISCKVALNTSSVTSPPGQPIYFCVSSTLLTAISTHQGTAAAKARGYYRFAEGAASRKTGRATLHNMARKHIRIIVVRSEPPCPAFLRQTEIRVQANHNSLAVAVGGSAPSGLICLWPGALVGLNASVPGWTSPSTTCMESIDCGCSLLFTPLTVGPEAKTRGLGPIESCKRLKINGAGDGARTRDVQLGKYSSV